MPNASRRRNRHRTSAKRNVKRGKVKDLRPCPFSFSALGFQTETLPEAVDEIFDDDEIDYVQLVKTFDGDAEQKKHHVVGNPVMADVSTSHVERQNLNMRMGMRRYTRLTNAFSKKLENHIHMLSIYFVYYNFVRPHISLEGKTPAMEAGLSAQKRSMGWLVDLVDARERKPRRPNTYRKRQKVC